MSVRVFTAIALTLSLAACRADTDQSTAELPAPDSVADSVDVASSETREPARDLITPDGWGPLRIGMTREQVVQAAGEDAQPNAVGGPDPQACDEFRPSNAPDGVLVMIENGVLTRISVSRNRDIATPEGIRIGDPTSAVLARYGARAQVQPHKYVEPPAKYLTVWDSAATGTERRGIRYEISREDEVVHIRAGGPSIEYVEGCL